MGGMNINLPVNITPLPLHLQSTKGFKRKIIEKCKKNKWVRESMPKKCFFLVED